MGNEMGTDWKENQQKLSDICARSLKTHYTVPHEALLTLAVRSESDMIGRHHSATSQVPKRVDSQSCPSTAERKPKAIRNQSATADSQPSLTRIGLHERVLSLEVIPASWVRTAFSVLHISSAGKERRANYCQPEESARHSRLQTITTEHDKLKMSKILPGQKK